ncbi:MAG: hypothetical protein PHW66_00690 [Gallionella sp.]|jgi:hypothetical protein|nr:hypothetical protein [Gallionella sp.]
MKILKKLAVMSLLAVLLPALSGCVLAVGAAAGGTAVYLLKDKGYEVQAPVKKK